MKAVIPAAGLGTRFLPATKAQPKEMLPVLDKPAIQYVVEEAAAGGLDDVLIITGRGKRAIEDHFDIAAELESFLEEKGDEVNLELVRGINRIATMHYIRQGESLGLGHAVLCAKNHVGDQAFAVLLGDTITTGKASCMGSLMKLQKEHGCSVIGVEQVPADKVDRYGIVAGVPLGGGLWKITDMVEKPAIGSAPSNLAIFGRYALSPKIFECLERTPPGRNGEIQLTDAMKILLQEEEILAFEITQPHYDIGNKFDWIKATIELSLLDPELGPVIAPFIKGLVQKESIESLV